MEPEKQIDDQQEPPKSDPCPVVIGVVAQEMHSTEAAPSGYRVADSSGGQPPSSDAPPLPWYRQFSLTDWITAISAFITAIATLVIMVWAGLQWYEMHTGGIDTHALAEAAQKQACAASKSAQAARDFANSAASIDGGIGDAVKKLDIQAKATQVAAESAVSANRAWMIPERYDQPNPVTIHFTWKNAGLSPAAQVGATAEYQQDDLRARFVRGCNHLREHLGWAITAPMVLQNAPFEITLENMPENWNSLPDKPNEIKVLQIHGCVWYKDVLTNRMRTTEFCYEAVTLKPKAPEFPRTTVFPNSCLSGNESLIFH